MKMVEIVMGKTHEHKNCKKCGGKPEIHGCDSVNDHGPWTVACRDCGDQSLTECSYNDAWDRWYSKNK